MMSLYLERQSWLHHLPAGGKLLGLCFFSVTLLPVDSVVILSGGLLAVLFLYLSAGREVVAEIRMLKPLLPFLAVILGLHIWAGSLWLGLAAVIRLLIMVLLANLVSLTTRMSDMMAAINPLFRPLEMLGFSSRRLSIAVALMIRFAPVLFAILETLGDAWRARSRRKPRWRLLAPFTLQALKMADAVGDALQSRGGAAGMSRQVSAHRYAVAQVQPPETG